MQLQNLIDWWKQIQFAYPTMLSLFAFIPFLIWWYVGKSNRAQATFTVSTSRAFAVSTFKSFLRHLPFILRLLALSSIIIALARPQRHVDERMTKGEGIDIILCIDVSGSMLSKDFLPNRLEAAKEVARQFILERPIDRIGLVAALVASLLRWRALRPARSWLGGTTATDRQMSPRAIATASAMPAAATARTLQA